MRLEQDRLGQIKNWIYIGSSAILFLTWCLSLAALTQGGGSDGHVAWVFGLCFLTIPLIIYQSLTPIWSRTARFSEPHAHCIVDGVLVVLWFSAWASLARYVISGKGHGKSTVKGATGCDNFAYGSATKCKISEVDIFFAVFMMLCFVATAFFSFKVLMEYRRTGIAPNTAQMFRGGSKISKTDISYPQKAGFETHEEEAFDARMDTGTQEHDGRDGAYSFEATRVHGGGPESMPYEGAYGGYASVPNGAEDRRYVQHERATSFGGPLGGSRV